jgi:dTDP-4-dehydrorhamnose 3,5-epimerase-like enzyme
MNKKIKHFKIEHFYRSDGTLVPFNFNKNFPIKVKRIFFLYGKKNKIRGDHAHKKCSQVFIPIRGNATLLINTPKNEKKITLKYKLKKGIIVPPKYWCGVKFYDSEAIVMVVCDRYYEVNDYIKNYNEYIKYLGAK